MKTTMKTTTGSVAAALAAVAVLAALAARTTEAQEAGALQPYLGCWEPLGAAPGEGVLCFVAADGHAEMLTLVDGAVEYREPFRVDGRERPVEQDGCRGSETARTSIDGRRIYTTSSFSCEGEAPRRSTGIISMPDPDAWLDVRAMEANGGATAWSRWYERAEGDPLAELDLRTGGRPFAGGGAVARATAPVTVEDVIDAVDNVHPKAVEAWVAELGQEFRGLDADDLVRMADAGVPDAIVDVVVAVSFPERFALNGDRTAPSREEAGMRRAGRPVWLYPAGYYDPYYGYGYSRYSRYGYGGYGRYGGWWSTWGGYGYNPVVVEVNRRVPDSGGRVVAGKGYRRGAPDAATSPGFPAGSGRSTIGSTGGSRSSPPPARGGSTGRKAKRRGK